MRCPGQERRRMKRLGGVAHAAEYCGSFCADLKGLTESMMMAQVVADEDWGWDRRLAAPLFVSERERLIWKTAADKRSVACRGMRKNDEVLI